MAQVNGDRQEHRRRHTSRIGSFSPECEPEGNGRGEDQHEAGAIDEQGSDNGVEAASDDEDGGQNDGGGKKEDSDEDLHTIGSSSAASGRYVVHHYEC